MTPTQTAFARAYGVGLSAAWLAGLGAAGAVVSTREAYPRTPQAAPAQGWPPARPFPEGRLAVAVVLGASSSVITGAFGPYEVFARSPTFFVYVCNGSRLLAATGLLDGHRAPSHWSSIRRLERSRPQVVDRLKDC